MANTCRKAIEEAFTNESGILETSQIFTWIYARYPTRPWKPNTISAHLVGLSDHPSSIHHPTLRRHGFLISLGKGRYRKRTSEDDVGGVIIDPPPPPPVTIADLARWRHNIIRLLNDLEGRPDQQEGLVSRIRRVARDGNIPRETVTLMMLIVEMRNTVEYEEKQLSSSEMDAIRSAWRAVREWGQTKGITLEP